MALPLIGAAARAGAKKLAEKFGKQGAKKTAEEKAEREAKAKIQKEAIDLDREVEEIGNKAYRSLDPKRGELDGSGKALAGAIVGVPAAIAGSVSYRAKKEAEEREEREDKDEVKRETRGMKKGGMVKSSASKRADGVAIKGKTKGRFV